ncbi:hypothetical protein [Granulicella paludicola]|uniref:hypothetical protein n=1 Tax=Granulicella paludicola TaxID=474951 RepID=UPI0021DFAAFF|nr:hypothetical protein [Granulicella paludicola]
MTSNDEVRAARPQAPAPSRALLRARAEQQERKQQRATVERRSVVRGLVLLALVALGISVARAGFERVFVPGWWRHF